MLQDKFFVRISAYLLDEIPITFIPNTIYELPNLTVYKRLLHFLSTLYIASNSIINVFISSLLYLYYIG